MNRQIFHYLQIAGKLAVSKENERAFLLGACGVRSDGRLVTALNSPTQIPTPEAHAERRLASKLDYGATVYVARVRLLDDSFALARPCYPCMIALASRRVKRIYYTISDGEYGIIDVADWLEGRG